MWDSGYRCFRYGFRVKVLQGSSCGIQGTGVRYDQVPSGRRRRKARRGQRALMIGAICSRVLGGSEGGGVVFRVEASAFKASGLTYLYLTRV